MQDESQNQDQPGWAFTGSNDDEPQSPVTHIDTINWSASEYIAHEKAPSWFAGVAAVAARVAAALFVVTRELLASITVLVVVFVGMFYAGRKPETRSYELSDKGLVVDGKHYSMTEFKSFSIVQEGAVESIWLESLGKFTPTIRLYFAPEDGQRIAGVLEQLLPYQQREIDAVEKASRRIRF